MKEITESKWINKYWGAVTLAGVSMSVFITANMINTYINLQRFQHEKEGWEKQ